MAINAKQSRRELISLVFQSRETMLSTTRPFRLRPLLVFISFPFLHATRPGRHVFEADKHAEASRKRPAPVLSLARLFITSCMFALSATSSLWSFTVCPGLKCDVSPHLPARWFNIAFSVMMREFTATNQLSSAISTDSQCSRFGFSRLPSGRFFTDLSWHFL